MSIWVYLYTGIAILAVALVVNVIIAGKTQRERREARNMPVKMQELTARYRVRRWWLLVLQMTGIGIMLLGTFIGK